jgi:hypothetical protein
MGAPQTMMASGAGSLSETGQASRSFFGQSRTFSRMDSLSTSGMQTSALPLPPVGGLLAQLDKYRQELQKLEDREPASPPILEGVSRMCRRCHLEHPVSCGLP